MWSAGVGTRHVPKVRRLIFILPFVPARAHHVKSACGTEELPPRIAWTHLPHSLEAIMVSGKQTSFLSSLKMPTRPTSSWVFDREIRNPDQGGNLISPLSVEPTSWFHEVTPSDSAASDRT